MIERLRGLAAAAAVRNVQRTAFGRTGLDAAERRADPGAFDGDGLRIGTNVHVHLPFKICDIPDVTSGRLQGMNCRLPATVKIKLPESDTRGVNDGA